MHLFNKWVTFINITRTLRSAALAAVVAFFGCSLMTDAFFAKP